MLSVIDYCLNIQVKLRRLMPENHDGRREWFGDTGSASRAVSFALDGKNSKALHLAEKLAEKYHII